MGEVWYVPSLPARVASIKASVGSAASGMVLTLAEGALRLTASLDPVNGPLVKSGMAASIWLQGDSSRQARAARVTSVGQMAVNNSSGMAIPVTVKGVAPLPMSWAGHNVVVSIRVSSTGGPVLAVPQAAVYSTADGAAHVVTYQGGREKVVPVSTGASVGGLVQVSAPSGVLRPGENVVLGVAGS
jgi:multidrug efflux pump subunit AcrA (membrane-fusion protein)